MASTQEERAIAAYNEHLGRFDKDLPRLSTVDLDEIEELAQRKLYSSYAAFTYVSGSAGKGLTHKANRAAFEKWQIIPRMLVNATHRDLATTIFGVTYPSPLILGPVGSSPTARAAAKLNVPFTLSTAGSRSIEDVATASANGPRWFQLYWPRSDDITLSLLKRAADNGYSALVVTLDTMQIGWRPEDLKFGYLPFIHGVGSQVGFSDPVFMARHGLPIVHERPAFPYEPEDLENPGGQSDNPPAFDDALRARKVLAFSWIAEMSSGTYRSWDDVPLIRNNWHGPLIFKGIQSAEDAERAIDVGADGIVVSNHGGRQVDGAIGSLDALELVMRSTRVREAQASGKFTILFDSGIRTGPDILKAVALGAQALVVPYVYGLALDGEAGVEAVVKYLLADLSLSMGLSGYKSLDDVRSTLASNMIRKT
ncbi:hypothetical protein BS47DRAFT_1372996 [Hydnum rufescens UP504]|uniref:FMN hydroxy acid dehydrogenase domain-containing protein n=1 Tax=Hydnum rufescens UP504 TaxID=1448309 RepID=A0A9P6AVR5_9AGAM|nr:hypothetical protein BS47DRAFT_1372996 [Hydnum rufescens UP504]